MEAVLHAAGVRESCYRCFDQLGLRGHYAGLLRPVQPHPLLCLRRVYHATSEPDVRTLRAHRKIRSRTGISVEISMSSRLVSAGKVACQPFSKNVLLTVQASGVVLIKRNET